MYERFTDQARQVMQLADDEARRRHQGAFGSEHILLGLVRQRGGVADAVLTNLGVDLKGIRVEVERELGAIVSQATGPNPSGALTATPLARRVIEYAVIEARQLQHAYVGTEHLLLALLRVRDTVVARVPGISECSVDSVRREVSLVLGDDNPTSQAASPPP